MLQTLLTPPLPLHFLLSSEHVSNKHGLPCRGIFQHEYLESGHYNPVCGGLSELLSSISSTGMTTKRSVQAGAAGILVHGKKVEIVQRLSVRWKKIQHRFPIYIPSRSRFTFPSTVSQPLQMILAFSGITVFHYVLTCS